MTPTKFYYISSGAKNAMRTLRHVISSPGYVRDEYVCNLCRDFDEAVKKARSIIGTKANLEASEFDLEKWGLNVNVKPWMRSQLKLVDNGIMPFGKHRGAEISTLDDGYVKYWVKQSATNIVGQAVVQKFTDVANERDLFAKWEKEEKEKQAAREEQIAKMNFVGKIGQRMELFIRCDKVLSFDTAWGGTHINLCVDRFGNKFVYKGSNRWEEGVYYKVKATIKKHDEYKGEKQNIISRPTIVKTVEKETV